MKAWAGSLGGIEYPLLSDFWPHGEVAQRYGVLRPEGYTERAIFVIDHEGIVRYIDIHDIDDQPDNQVLFDVLTRLAATNPAVKHIPEPAPGEPLPHGGIVMYCNVWCPDCTLARQWFKSCDLTVTEVDVSKNPLAAEQVRKWNNGNLTTPTFDIDGIILTSFDKNRISEILGL